MAHHQFFTSDQGLIYGTWFPMDHFFYAPARHHKGHPGFVENGVVAYLEGHANINHPNGFSIDVVSRQGRKRKSESFDDYPSALRRMADIIEEHTKTESQKKEARRLKRKTKPSSPPG